MNTSTREMYTKSLEIKRKAKFGDTYMVIVWEMLPAPGSRHLCLPAQFQGPFDLQSLKIYIFGGCNWTQGYFLKSAGESPLR